MTDKPHTPIGVHQDVLQAYISQGGTIERFYDWLDSTQARAERRGLNEKREEIEAAAEQRGAERAFDEAVEEIASMEGNRMILARYKHLNPYRADLMEGDDE